MRSVNPSCKFIGILLSAVILALFYIPELNLGVFVVCLVAALLSHVRPKALFLALTPGALMAAGLLMSAYHFSSDTVAGLHREMFSDARIYNGLLLAGRILAFSGLGILFALTTDKIEFIQSLNQQLKLPDAFAYSVTAAWGMLPNMAREYVKTKMAFRVRGLRTGFISTALLIPLLVKSIRWSEALAVSMESRGFGSGARTAYRRLKVRTADVLFPIGACALILTAALAL
jgi:energy-coupling factor transporter transmembrane protein EcfT